MVIRRTGPLIRKPAPHAIENSRCSIEIENGFDQLAFIRTSYVILELPADILEVPDRLLEEPDHLFELLPLILEDPPFIRTFPGLLENPVNLLEVPDRFFTCCFY
ncbi:hypothetical protein MKX73_03505 [Solibacillus sp. FSL W7-1436]|uniref:hypothetical protein n=1 Tax=Solibacillus sp. FSL W7-1436 TaxID=2921705 RepID=UPI0030FBC04C